MAYTKQGFEDGQVLTAAHLNHIETGIKMAHDLAASGSGGSGGKGISSIKKTAGTGAPGTKDTYTITYTDGTTTTYTVYNGKDGASGQTPVKGVDYWTETERQDMAEEAASLVNVDPTPDYIVAEAERVAQNVQNVRTARTLVFPALTDLHLYEGNATHDASLSSAKYAGMGIREMKKRISMDGVVLLGDYSWMSGDDYDVAQVKADIVACKTALGLAGNEIWCIGNHDLNYGKGRDRLMTLDEMYAYIGANSDGVKPWGSIERGYGFRDFDAQKIRIIYLNTCDGSDWLATEGKEAQASWISPTQLQWLADTALDFSGKADPSEWGIVLVGHHPLHYSNGSFGYVMKLLEAYRDGLSGSLSCTIRTETVDGATTYPQQKVTYDFSAAERAEIICNIHGHNHNCGMSQISSTSWYTTIPESVTPVDPWLWRLGIPQICFGRNNSPIGSTAAGFEEKYGEFDNNGDPVYWEKESGTAKATSFCVVSIDRSNKKVYAHIFGAGRDRVVSYAEEYVPAEYTITVTAENCSGAADNATTISEDGAVTLTFTANDGYELSGAVSVTGAAHTWDKTSGSLVLSIPTGPVTVTVTAVAAVVEPSYTNLIPTATDTDGSIYNGKGYKEDTRLNGNGVAETRAGQATTGFIPVPETNSYDKGQVVLRFSNMVLDNTTLARIACYDENKTYIGLKYGSQLVTENTDGVNDCIATWDSNGYLSVVDMSELLYYYKLSVDVNKVVKYLRICGTSINDDSIITVNEPIE